jgi:steroid 5-alpha reductase family enzyme
MSPLPLLATALGLSSLLMTVVWFVAMRIRNAGIVDIAWALGFAPLALLYRGFADGEPARQNLVTLMVVLWSLRLGHHLWKRVMGHHPVEDGRYGEMRRAVAGREGVVFFWFFQAQALLLAILSIPCLLIDSDPRVHLGMTDLLGFGLWIVALGGESLADRQLAAFKADPANRGKVCAAGLWSLSRHPNYFFEWLVWVGLFVMALPAPWGVLTVFAPALILFLLLKVTGIPYTEQQAVRSKGDAYRRYQQTTSAFFPWFPRVVSHPNPADPS